MQDNLDESTTAIIEHFTVLIYDRTSELLSVNEKKVGFQSFHTEVKESRAYSTYTRSI